jgi:hypothetical protein
MAAPGEVQVNMVSDRGSTPLASTSNAHNRTLLGSAVGVFLFRRTAPLGVKLPIVQHQQIGRQLVEMNPGMLPVNQYFVQIVIDIFLFCIDCKKLIDPIPSN